MRENKRSCYFYQFEDGYYCYYVGNLTKSELVSAIKKHGEVVRIIER